MHMLPPNPFRESRLNSNDDYRPEWDVLELNGRISGWLVDEVRRLVGRAEPDPGQMIAVITGPPGYGKTHLFGRIAHQVGQDVFFVFVPAFEPESPPLDHIRRHVVNALCRRNGDQPSPLDLALARLCRPALADYFADLPPTLAARHDSIRRRLGESDLAALEVVRSVKTLAPFRRLADSLVSVLPRVDAAAIRALALGWAPLPWSETARKWLQGQDLPEADLAALGLPEENPSAMDVLKAIPPLLGHKTPMMICCDQIEGILQGQEKLTAIGALTQSLMDILLSIPIQIVLSCFKDSWEGKKDSRDGINAFNAFQMRVKKPLFQLDSMKPDQAIRLVASRVSSWPGHPSEKPAIWPFRQDSIQQTVIEFAPTPRGLIQDCARKFDQWLEDKSEDEIPIEVGGGPAPDDPRPAFLVEWNNEIEAIRKDPNRALGQQPEDRLYAGVLEALKLAHSARMLRDFGGVKITDIQDKIIKATAPARRPGALVSMAGGPGEPATGVVVALTTIESAQKFNFYLKAVSQAADKSAGFLLIHPRRQFYLGNNAQVFLELEQKKGRYRLLALEDHSLTYQALEALVALLKRAEERELILNGVTMTPEDCRDLVIKTGVIDNLDLFKMLGHARKAASKVDSAQAAPAATASGVAAEATKKPDEAAQTQPSGGTSASTPAAAKPSTSPPPTPPPSPTPRKDHTAWAEEKLAQAVKKLKLYNQVVEPDGVEIGPTFARLRVVPTGKASCQTVKNRAVDLRISLGLKVVPIVGDQAGYISIDVQLPERSTVTLAEALAGPPGNLKAGDPAFPVGQDVGGQTHWLNLAEPSDCHVLVAGTTGSGKSEFLRALVAALAARLDPDQIRFVLIDPKRVTFNLNRPSPYLRDPIAHDLEAALPLIRACEAEMDRRYALLQERKLTNVADLPADLLPRIVVVIDEFASFLEDKESKKVITGLLKRLGAMARAAGIHLVLATQRPDKDVIVPVLRENLPGRIALAVTNKAGSELILGSPEAEHLLGKGDLFWKRGGELLRLQSPFASQAELEARLRVGHS